MAKKKDKKEVVKDKGYYLSKMYQMPIGIIEYYQDENGKTQLGMMTPEIVRLLAGYLPLPELIDLDPFNGNEDLLNNLKQEMI